jgi:hypothetical protein
VAGKTHVPLIDPFPALVEAAGGKVPGNELFGDSFHPLPRGHQVLGRAICEGLVEQGVLAGALPWDRIRLAGVDGHCGEIVLESNLKNLNSSHLISQALRYGKYERAVEVGKREGEDWLRTRPVSLFEYGWALTLTGRLDEARELFDRSRDAIFPMGTSFPDLSTPEKMIEHAFAGDVFAYF